MKKKVLAMLLCLTLILCLGAAPALAGGEPTISISIGGLPMHPGDYYVNGADSTTSTSAPKIALGQVIETPAAPPESWNAHLTYDVDAGYVLTVQGLKLSLYAGNCIYSNHDLTIDLAGDYSDLEPLRAASDTLDAIRVDGDLTITAQNAGYSISPSSHRGCGVYVTGDLNVNSGQVTGVTHYSGGGKAGVWTEGSLSVAKDAALLAVAGGDAEGSAAIHAADGLTVTGKVDAQMAADNSNGVTAGSLTMDGGTLAIYFLRTNLTNIQALNLTTSMPTFSNYGDNGYMWTAVSGTAERNYTRTAFVPEAVTTYVRILPATTPPPGPLTDVELLLTYTGNGRPAEYGYDYSYRYDSSLDCSVLTIHWPGAYTLSMADDGAVSHDLVRIDLGLSADGYEEDNYLQSYWDYGDYCWDDDFDPSVELTLDNVSLELDRDDAGDWAENGYTGKFGCIENKNADLTLILKGKNSITLAEEEFPPLELSGTNPVQLKAQLSISPCAIFSEEDEDWLLLSDLTVKGSGRLDISGGFTYGIVGNQINFLNGTTDIDLSAEETPLLREVAPTVRPPAAAIEAYAICVVMDADDYDSYHDDYRDSETRRPIPPTWHALNIGRNMQIVGNGTPLYEQYWDGIAWVADWNYSDFWDYNFYDWDWDDPPRMYYLGEYLLDENGDDLLQATIKPKSGGGGGGGTGHTVSATTGAGGSVSPAGSVSVSSGAERKFTLTPEPGYIVWDVIVDGVSQGPRGTYTFADVQAKHTIEARFAQGALSNFALGSGYAGYPDVDESQWYGAEREGVIRDATLLGIVQGDRNGFRPGDSVKLSEVIKMAAVVYNTYYGSLTAFDQSQGEQWYDTYVSFALSHGLIKAGDFANYDRPATRAEMAYIFAHSLPADALTAISSLTPPDVAANDSYAAEIRLLYAAGALRGNDTAGTFDAGRPISRAETAAIVTRICLPEKRTAK